MRRLSSINASGNAMKLDNNDKIVGKICQDDQDNFEH